MNDDLISKLSACFPVVVVVAVVSFNELLLTPTNKH